MADELTTRAPYQLFGSTTPVKKGGDAPMDWFNRQRVTSWRTAETSPIDQRLNAPTTDAVVSTLYQWGPVQFEVWPLNVHEVDHETGTSWAQKEIVGAAIYREWTGENDETLYFRGRVFPYRIGGMTNLEALDAMRRKGIANLLMRGRGDYMGWYVIEHLVRIHTDLSGEGVGQMVAFEAQFVRVPIPPADNFFSELWGTAYVGKG